MIEKTTRSALPVNHQLNGHQIQMVLEPKELGFTYLALTRFLQLVAVEEFFPSKLATRDADGSVRPTSIDAAEAYHKGLNFFIAETNSLAQLRQASIPCVYPALELNNTAYRIMDYQRGKSLESVLHKVGIDGEQNIRDVLMPLLDGVEYVHRAGLVHGGIQADTIILRKKSLPLLLGFSSALASDNTNKPEPWVDIYALAACFYPAIAGQAIPDMPTRIRTLVDGGPDPLKPATESTGGHFSRPFLAAIDKALAIQPEERLQSVAQWRVLLNADKEAIKVEPPYPSAPQEPTPTSARQSLIDPDKSSSTQEKIKQSVVADAVVVADTAVLDPQIAARQSPPRREEAGIAAKRILSRARAAAQEAAEERARNKAESAAIWRSRRRWLTATVFIMATIAWSLSVLYRPTALFMEKL